MDGQSSDIVQNEVENLKKYLMEEFRVHQRMIRFATVNLQTLLKKKAIQMCNSLEQQYKDKCTQLDKIASPDSSDDNANCQPLMISDDFLTSYAVDYIQCGTAIENLHWTSSPGTSGMTAPVIAAGIQAQVTVSGGITKTGVFWIRLSDISDSNKLALMNLQDRISLSRISSGDWKSYKETQSLPAVGDRVLADSAYGWVRGQVEKLRDENSCYVRLLDYGDLLPCEINVLFPAVETLFTNFEYQALGCTLALEKDSLPLEAVWAFGDIIAENKRKDEPIICTFIAKGPSQNGEELWQVDLTVKDDKGSTTNLSELINRKICDVEMGKDSIFCRDIRFTGKECLEARRVEVLNEIAKDQILSSSDVTKLKEGEDVKAEPQVNCHENSEIQKDALDSCGDNLVEPVEEVTSTTEETVLPDSMTTGICGTMEAVSLFGNLDVSSQLEEKSTVDENQAALEGEQVHFLRQDTELAVPFSYAEDPVQYSYSETSYGMRSRFMQSASQKSLVWCESQPVARPASADRMCSASFNLNRSKSLSDSINVTRQPLPVHHGQPFNQNLPVHPVSVPVMQSVSDPDAVPFIYHGQAAANLQLDACRQDQWGHPPGLDINPNILSFGMGSPRLMGMSPYFGHVDCVEQPPSDYVQMPDSKIRPAFMSGFVFPNSELTYHCAYLSDGTAVNSAFSQVDDTPFEDIDNSQVSAYDGESASARTAPVQTFLPSFFPTTGFNFIGNVVTNLEENGCFFMQLARTEQKQVDAWNNLKETLETYDKLTLPLNADEVSTGQIVIAASQRNRELYRAEVLSLKDRNKAILCNINPNLHQRYSFHETTRKQFDAIVKGKILKATVLFVGSDNISHVELKNCSGENVFEVMKHSVPCSEPFSSQDRLNLSAIPYVANSCAILAASSDTTAASVFNPHLVSPGIHGVQFDPSVPPPQISQQVCHQKSYSAHKMGHEGHRDITDQAKHSHKKIWTSKRSQTPPHQLHEPGSHSKNITAHLMKEERRTPTPPHGFQAEPRSEIDRNDRSRWTGMKTSTDDERGKVRNSNRVITCYNCNKHGHYKNNCPLLPPQMRKVNQKYSSAQRVQSEK